MKKRDTQTEERAGSKEVVNRRLSLPPSALRLFIGFSPLLLLTLVFLWGPLVLLSVEVAQRVATRPALLMRVLPLDPVRAALFKNTVELGVLTTFLALLLGLPCAVALARGPHWIRALVALGCALPLAMPPIVPASLLVPLTFAPGRDSPRYPAVLLAAPVLAACLYPLVAFGVAAAMRALPQDAEDAARLYGGETSVWRGVLLPLLRPAIGGAAGLVFAFTLWEMGAPDLLNLQTYAVQIYRDWNGGVLGEDATLAALDAVPLAALGALALGVALRALRFYERLRVAGGSGPEHLRARSGSRLPARGAHIDQILGVLALFIVALSPGVVIIWLTKVAGGVSGAGAAWHEVTDFANEELLTTLQWAPLSALLLLAWAFCLVAPRRLASDQADGRGRELWRWSLLLPMLCPPVTLGLAMATFWNYPWGVTRPGAPTFALQDAVGFLWGSGGMTMIGYAARFLPPAVWLIGEATARVSRESTEAAQSLGANPRFAARTILLPALLPALAGTGAVLGALCVGELTVSVLLAQAGGQPLTVPLFSFMHAGEADLVATLSLALFSVGAGIMVLFALLLIICETVRRKLAHR